MSVGILLKTESTTSDERNAVMTVEGPVCRLAVSPICCTLERENRAHLAFPPLITRTFDLVLWRKILLRVILSLSL